MVIYPNFVVDLKSYKSKNSIFSSNDTDEYIVTGFNVHLILVNSNIENIATAIDGN